MNLVEVKNFLKENFRKESEKYFGVTDDIWIDHVTNNWFNDNENYDGRWQFISSNLPSIGTVFDMAAGCGTFVLNGLQNGYDVYGVEPEDWKREYFQKKIFASNYPSQWNDRIIYALGEALPFEDEHFDLVTSYQTLEHVQNPVQVLREMIRVTKKGGYIFLRCPDYRSTFEPHYKLPWLPLLPRCLAKVYLSVLKRPTTGLDTIQYITLPRVLNWLSVIENEGNMKFVIVNNEKLRFDNAMRRRGIPNSIGALLWKFFNYKNFLFNYIKILFRSEISLFLFIHVESKNSCTL